MWGNIGWFILGVFAGMVTLGLATHVGRDEPQSHTCSSCGGLGFHFGGVTGKPYRDPVFPHKVIFACKVCQQFDTPQWAAVAASQMAPEARVEYAPYIDREGNQGAHGVWVISMPGYAKIRGDVSRQSRARRHR